MATAPDSQPDDAGEATLASPPAAREWLGSLIVLIYRMATWLPPAQQPAVRAALARLEPEAADHASLTQMLASLRPTLAHPSLPPVLLRHWRQHLRRAAANGLDPAVVTATTDLLYNTTPSQATPQPREIDDAPIDLSFSQAEEFYIGNAGLILVAPFLPHFFTHLGLLGDDRHFTDPAARQRAIGLLQAVATGDPDPPEYVLPLNKVLCGLDLAEVFDFGPPISQAEADECTQLLSAVIAQAPILNNMSINGFQGSFMLRQGILRPRDGAWLLQVERETYDVVLDRLPWTFSWVKLPWMDTLLQVEW